MIYKNEHEITDDVRVQNPVLAAVDCHTCGCVVRKEIAFRGHDRIEREKIHTDYPEFTEVVYETWYCKLHKRGKKAYGSK